MSRVILIRHGETAWNNERRIQGNLDQALSPRGLAQAGRVADALVARKIAAIYSSPLRRSLETAEAVARRLGLGVRVERDLREMGLGEWEGLTVEDIGARYGDLYRRWLANPLGDRPPGAEPLEAFQRRVVACIDGARAGAGSAELAVVTHGGVIKAYLCAVMGLPMSQLFRIRVDNAAINEVAWDAPLPRVALLNDTCHLDGRGHAEMAEVGEGPMEPAF